MATITNQLICMAIAFENQFKNTTLGENLKCTIQSSGKLGFTEKTISAMNLDENTAFNFYPDNDRKDVFYLIKTTKDDPNAFPVKKSGKYYYINTRTLFGSLGFDYKNDNFTIAFDMIRDLEQEQDYNCEIYKLVQRLIVRGDNSETEE